MSLMNCLSSTRIRIEEGRKFRARRPRPPGERSGIRTAGTTPSKGRNPRSEKKEELWKAVSKRVLMESRWLGQSRSSKDPEAGSNKLGRDRPTVWSPI